MPRKVGIGLSGSYERSREVQLDTVGTGELGLGLSKNKCEDNGT